MKIKAGLMTKLFLALTVSFGQKARNHCSVFKVYLIRLNQHSSLREVKSNVFPCRVWTEQEIES